jgi:hypothetical protein
MSNKKTFYIRKIIQYFRDLFRSRYIFQIQDSLYTKDAGIKLYGITQFNTMLDNYLPQVNLKDICLSGQNLLVIGPIPNYIQAYNIMGRYDVMPGGQIETVDGQKIITGYARKPLLFIDTFIFSSRFDYLRHGEKYGVWLLVDGVY